jgi:hypothetical protein
MLSRKLSGLPDCACAATGDTANATPIMIAANRLRRMMSLRPLNPVVVIRQFHS